MKEYTSENSTDRFSASALLLGYKTTIFCYGNYLKRFLNGFFLCFFVFSKKSQRESQILTDMNTIRKYTYRRCMIDCRVESFVKYCNCIPFYYGTFKKNRIFVSIFWRKKCQIGCFWLCFRRLSQVSKCDHMQIFSYELHMENE